jgi:hypothetical protein
VTTWEGDAKTDEAEVALDGEQDLAVRSRRRDTGVWGVC